MGAFGKHPGAILVVEHYLTRVLKINSAVVTSRRANCGRLSTISPIFLVPAPPVGPLPVPALAIGDSEQEKRRILGFRAERVGPVHFVPIEGKQARGTTTKCRPTARWITPWTPSRWGSNRSSTPLLPRRLSAARWKSRSLEDAAKGHAGTLAAADTRFAQIEAQVKAERVALEKERGELKMGQDQLAKDMAKLRNDQALLEAAQAKLLVDTRGTLTDLKSSAAQMEVRLEGQVRVAKKRKNDTTASTSAKVAAKGGNAASTSAKVAVKAIPAATSRQRSVSPVLKRIAPRKRVLDSNSESSESESALPSASVRKALGKSILKKNIPNPQIQNLFIAHRVLQRISNDDSKILAREQQKNSREYNNTHPRAERASWERTLGHRDSESLGCALRHGGKGLLRVGAKDIGSLQAHTPRPESNGRNGIQAPRTIFFAEFQSEVRNSNGGGIRAEVEWAPKEKDLAELKRNFIIHTPSRTGESGALHWHLFL
ncbi:hypothetical protein B0H16DRAFT_1687093 [Mycena metata]|uniref:Uncharacterized protein n=1 Tax=Mycena metata TaxID=1033252 RepID=A0AAD7NM64_9AGAR|nr:hypothetical protein B0H16DRAFT_1687093 [Mycena metata]